VYGAGMLVVEINFDAVEFYLRVLVRAAVVRRFSDQFALRHQLACMLHTDFIGMEPELAAAGVEVGDEGGSGLHGSLIYTNFVKIFYP